MSRKRFSLYALLKAIIILMVILFMTFIKLFDELYFFLLYAIFDDLISF